MYLTVALIATIIVFIALVVAFVRLMVSIVKQSQTPQYLRGQLPSQKPSIPPAYPEGADELDGSSYAAVHGDVRLE